MQSGISILLLHLEPHETHPPHNTALPEDMKAIIAGFIIIWLWVVFVMVAAHGQPSMPPLPKAPTRPILSPKQAGQQPGRTMAKGSLVVNASVISTNPVNVMVQLGYDVTPPMSNAAPFLAFFSSSNNLDWRYIGKADDVASSNQVFTTTSTNPAMFYKCMVIIRPIFLTNISVTNINP